MHLLAGRLNNYITQVKGDTTPKISNLHPFSTRVVENLEIVVSFA
jgi:hypothetical protein